MTKIVPIESIVSKIVLLRGEKVLLDRDLAELYGVETKVLKQAVRRNIKRFPDDFMFELSKEEFEDWRSQFVTSNSDKIGFEVKEPKGCYGKRTRKKLSEGMNNGIRQRQG